MRLRGRTIGMPGSHPRLENGSPSGSGRNCPTRPWQTSRRAAGAAPLDPVLSHPSRSPRGNGEETSPMTAKSRFATAAALWLGAAAGCPAADDGVFVRFRLRTPEAAKYYVVLGGHI